jgi:hypothetical protein
MADDRTGGKFGDRTFMISAVSGGALGAATWLGVRADGIPPVPDANMHSGGVSPTALRLSRFYRQDFVSPAINRMLIHDLPMAAWPWGESTSDRDTVLTAKFIEAWNTVAAGAGKASGQGGFFNRTIASLRDSQGVMPLIVFNATSAADGHGAIYSNYPEAISGAWHLNSRATIARAVLDSARFALVSPVGFACADGGAYPVPLIRDFKIQCEAGEQALAIADGGYHDNSGLAPIARIITELSQLGDKMNDIFVIQIVSNPDEGVPQFEGFRFDNGRLIPEVLAPAVLQEAARSAHSDAYESQILGNRRTPEMYRWFLSNATEVSNAALQRPRKRLGIEWFDRRAHQAEQMRWLRSPPLGWTIDPISYRALYADSLRIDGIPGVGNCDSEGEKYDMLCRRLLSASSPRVDRK